MIVKSILDTTYVPKPDEPQVHVCFFVQFYLAKKYACFAVANNLDAYKIVFILDSICK